MCSSTFDIATIVSLSYRASPEVRPRALKEMCPCRVKGDIYSFWRRVLVLVEDPDARVRRQVLHTLCDGSPRHLEDEVAGALGVFTRDLDPLVRRLAGRVVAVYNRTGKWNIL